MSDVVGKLASDRIPSLDGLRAISIMLVIIGHSLETAPASVRSLPHIWTFLGNGQLGVRMFFVISGFLITSLLLKERQKTGRISIRGFYLRRVLRIFPAFYLYLGVVAILVGLGALHLSLADLLLAGTFTWNYGHLFIAAVGDWKVIGQFWTLALEEQFYLFWPLTMLFLGNHRARNVALAIIVLSPFLRVATYFLLPGTREFTAMMLHTAADPLMFGAATAMMQGNARFESILGRVMKPSLIVLAGSFVLIISPLIKMRFKGAYDLPVGVTVESLCLALILLFVVRTPQSVCGKLLNARPLVLIGVLSYSLYLWNPLFFSGANKTWTAAFPMGFICTFATAAFSYWCVELPFLRLKSKITPLKGHNVTTTLPVAVAP